MSERAIVILTASDAHRLVHFAATELQRYLRLLFALDAPVYAGGCPDDLPSSADIFIVGETHGEPLAGLLAQRPAPSPLSDQSIWLCSANIAGRRALLIAGGSPVATLWAVYEVVERWGVRYEMMGDVLPPKRPFAWLEWDEFLQPAFTSRILSPKNNLPESAASWAIEDYYRYIDQMVKLKFNVFEWRMREWGPWLQYEFKGYRKQRGDVYYGYRMPIRPDAIGKAHFGGEAEFYPPTLKAAHNDAERFALAERLLHDVLAYARSRGLQVALELELTDLPTDFKDKMNEWISEEMTPAGDWSRAYHSTTSLVEYGVNPQRLKWRIWMHPLVQELGETRIRALVDTFPEADIYLMGQTEHVASVVGFERCLDYLDERYGIRAKLDIDAMLRHADRYDFLTKHGRYESTLKGELEFLYFYDRLFAGRRVMATTRRPTAAVGMVTGFVLQEYFPILPDVLPPGTIVQGTLEYTFHRTARRMDSYAPLKGSGLRVWAFSTFQDDNNMWLPQVCVRSIHQVAQAALRHGLKGLGAAHWEVRPYEISCRYLAKVAWDPALTPDAFYARELADTFGPDAVPTLQRAFADWEALDVFNRDRLIGLAHCWHGVYEKFVTHPDRFNADDIRQSIVGFRKVLAQFVAARDQVTPAGRRYLEYYINRLECAIAFEELALLGQQIGRTYAAARAAYAAGDEATAEARRNEALALVEQALNDAEKMLCRYAVDIVAVEDKAVLAGFNRWIWYYMQAIRDEICNQPVGSATLTDPTR